MTKNRVFFHRCMIFGTAVTLMAGWLLQTHGAAFAQTATGDSAQRAIMKIEESTHNLTPENQETKQVIISKVYDTQDPLGNSYLLRVNDNNKAVVIDPGYNYEAIIKYLGQLNVDVEAILLTNGGFIRIAGNGELLKKWPNATILVGEQDAGLLTDPKANMSSEFGGVTSPIANVWLKDGDAFEIAGLPISVVGTPGFTSGSLTYTLATDDAAIAFTGDFIYKEGISSGSMPTSNETELHKSLDYFLDSQFTETLVFPGHGENTSVAEFYQQMTGSSISVIADNNTPTGDSPIIIVERDPATVVVTQQPIYVPTVEYRTETIYVDRYVRPWVNVDVGIPLTTSWYRPWNDYYYYRPTPLPVYSYRPYPGWSLYFGWSNASLGFNFSNNPRGYYPPPLVVPPRSPRPVLPPNYTQPRREFGGPGWSGQPGPGRPGITPPVRPIQPGPGRPNPTQPGPGRQSPGQPGSSQPTPVTPPQRAQPTPVTPSQRAQPTPVTPPQRAQPTPVTPSQRAQPTPVTPPQRAQPTPVTPQRTQPTPAAPQRVQSAPVTPQRAQPTPAAPQRAQPTLAAPQRVQSAPVTPQRAQPTLAAPQRAQPATTRPTPPARPNADASSRPADRRNSR